MWLWRARECVPARSHLRIRYQRSCPANMLCVAAYVAGACVRTSSRSAPLKPRLSHFVSTANLKDYTTAAPFVMWTSLRPTWFCQQEHTNRLMWPPDYLLYLGWKNCYSSRGKVWNLSTREAKCKTLSLYLQGEAPGAAAEDWQCVTVLSVMRRHGRVKVCWESEYFSVSMSVGPLLREIRAYSDTSSHHLFKWKMIKATADESDAFQ